MKRVLILTILVTFSVFAQFVEWSIPAPSDYITGLANSNMSYRIYAVDSVDNVVYWLDSWDGDILGTTVLPYFPNPPVGLACKDDTLWFAESGTAIVHAVSLSGIFLGTTDFSDSGPENITGIGFYVEYPDELLLADAVQNIIYSVYFEDNMVVIVDTFLVLGECPEVHDLGGFGGLGIPVACEDIISPVRIYEDDSLYTPLYYGDFISATGVARVMCNRFYFSDPVMGLIHRYCTDMGAVEEEVVCSSSSLELIPNPFANTVKIMFDVPSTGCVTLRLLDISGRLIETLFDEEIEPGLRTITLSATDLPSGFYFITLNHNETFQIQRCVHLK